VGVGDLNAEGNTLTAEIALCHFASPLTYLESRF
jgi:hypothetical protein